MILGAIAAILLAGRISPTPWPAGMRTILFAGAPTAEAGAVAEAGVLLPETDPEDAVPPLTAYFVMRLGEVVLLPYMPGDGRGGGSRC